jgi:putative DNA primase/helicase
MTAVEDRYADQWEGLVDNLPPFASEMPDHALASYLNPTITPLQLPLGLPPAMPFDDGLLPDALRGFVRDAADRTQCPPDFVAVALIVAIGAVVGRKFTIHPKQHDDWEVVPNQWGCIIGRPSAMKSPALKHALRPLAALEAKEREKHSEAMSEHKAAGEVLELERKSAKGKAKKLFDDGDKSGALAELTKFADDLPPPIPRRYIVNDASVEKLGELLNENPNGLLLVRDELGGWLAVMQTEDGAVGRAFYLECFDGNGSFTYDRIGRGTVFIESCCLSLIGGIQPSRIAPLVRGAVTGELDDGLVQRLQLAVWPDDDREWQLVDRWPNKAARERVEAVIHDLDQLPDDPRQALHFDAAAQALFNTWYIEHMQEIRRGEIHPALQSHFMKMPQTIAGLALLFELIDGGRNTVGAVATARALDWADYLKSHAGRLYGAAINAPLMGARLIYERRDKLPEPFTPRETRLKGWAGLDNLEAVNDALAILADHHLVIGYEVAGEKGGRPSKRYVWRRAA